MNWISEVGVLEMLRLSRKVTLDIGPRSLMAVLEMSITFKSRSSESGPRLVIPRFSEILRESIVTKRYSQSRLAVSDSVRLNLFLK